MNEKWLLARKYESGGDPGCVSVGDGDLGGISYGLYQLSSAAGSVRTFLAYCRTYPNAALANYGAVLEGHPVNSPAFVAAWREIGATDPDGFAELQDGYATRVYYDAAAAALNEAGYDVAGKSAALQAVLFSRAVQYGSGVMVELFEHAVRRIGYPNLTYVDDPAFDAAMIEAIYDFLLEECAAAYPTVNGNYHSPQDWVNGSESVVKNGLRNRFANEKNDALALLAAER